MYAPSLWPISCLAITVPKNSFFIAISGTLYAILIIGQNFGGRALGIAYKNYFHYFHYFRVYLKIKLDKHFVNWYCLDTIY